MITHNDTLKNQVDNAIKAADVFASPVQGEGDRREAVEGLLGTKESAIKLCS